MPLSFLKPQETLPTLVVFGKLPSRPDFIRLNASHPVAQELDERLQAAMESIWLHDGWEARYDSAPPSDLIYTSADRRWQFHGTLLPSRDQAGRRFPLLAGILCGAQEMRGRLPLIPVAREAFFQALRSHLVAFGHMECDGMDCREYLELNHFQWSSDPFEWELADGIRTQAFASETATTFGRVMKASTADFRQALLNMAFYRDFLRRFTTPSTAQLISLPLGVGPGEAAIHASIWLTLLSALALVEGRERECALVSHGDPQAHLRVSFGRGQTRLLAAALGQPLDDEAFLDISLEHTTWQAHRLYAQSAYAMDRLTEDPDLRLAHLLPFLVELQQKIALSSH